MSEQSGFLVYVVEDQNRVVLVALVPRREGRQRHPDRVAELLFVAAVEEYLLRAGPVVVFRAGAEVFQPDLVDRPVGDHHALAVTPHGLQPVGFGSDLDPAAAGDVGDPHDRHGVGGGVLQVGRRAEDLSGGGRRGRGHCGFFFAAGAVDKAGEAEKQK